MKGNVHFIKIVRQENGRRYNAGSAGSLHVHLDTPKEDVPFRLNSRGIALLLDDKLGAVVGVAGIAGADGAPVVAVGAVGEVDRVSLGEGSVVTASSYTGTPC